MKNGEQLLYMLVLEVRKQKSEVRWADAQREICIIRPVSVDRPDSVALQISAFPFLSVFCFLPSVFGFRY
jgi:hypothetical protein